MTQNVGGIAPTWPIVVGLVLVTLATPGSVGWWGWSGALPLATGLLGWCPPYAIFGWNTCKLKK